MGKFQKERKMQIKDKVKEEMLKMSERRQKKGKNEEVSEKRYEYWENEKKKEILFIEQEFQIERE